MHKIRLVLRLYFETIGRCSRAVRSTGVSGKQQQSLVLGVCIGREKVRPVMINHIESRHRTMYYVGVDRVLSGSRVQPSVVHMFSISRVCFESRWRGPILVRFNVQRPPSRRSLPTIE